MKRRLIVGISGATGIIYEIRLLEALREASVETHLIVSKAAEVTRTYETDLSSQDLRNLADISYPIGDIGAPIATNHGNDHRPVLYQNHVGTSQWDYEQSAHAGRRRSAEGAPAACLAAQGVPAHDDSHLEHAHTLGEWCGNCPSVPAFYALPKTIDEVVRHTVGRVLDLFDIDTDSSRWGEQSSDVPSASPISSRG
jgi:flavin prenyltransferase